MSQRANQSPGIESIDGVLEERGREMKTVKDVELEEVWRRYLPGLTIALSDTVLRPAPMPTEDELMRVANPGGKMAGGSRNAQAGSMDSLADKRAQTWSKQLFTNDYSTQR